VVRRVNDLDGSLKVFEPISVLQLVNLAQATGELRFSTGHNTARVFFDRGNVTFAAIENRPVRLGERLLREKRIRKKDLDDILQKKASGERLGKLLLDAGVIQEAELRTAIEEQIKEVVYEVVRWRTGVFSFAVGKTPGPHEILIDMPVDHLVLEGLKRLDEEGRS
jgi:hypothetical protein